MGHPGADSIVTRDVPAAAQVSIAIPNWNGADILPECLASVYGAARRAGFGADADIVVADDGSSDASALIVRRNFPAVRLFELGTRSGFGAAANAAVEQARRPYVLLLNTDATLDPDFFLAWPRAFADPDTFAVTSWMLRSDRRTVDSGRRVAVWDKGLIRHWVVQERGEAAPSLYASGGGSIYQREKFLALGGFDPLYAPMYAEDLDLSYVAWKRGWRTVYEPRCVVFHRGSYSTMRSMGEWRKYLVETRNHFLFIWKNITDRALISRHLAWLPLRLGAAPFHGRRMLAAGFLAALSHAGEALGRRRATRPFHVVSDRSIFDRLRPTAHDLAHSAYRGTAGAS
jgi:GT2 family glycosyltransferase